MNILDAIRLATELADKVRNVELKDALVTVKMEAVDLAEEAVRLRKENLELRDAAKLRAAMIWHDDLYWQKASDDTEVGPFCPKCWGARQEANRLADAGGHRLRCSVCDHMPYKPGGRDAERREEESQPPPYGGMPWSERPGV